MDHFLRQLVAHLQLRQPAQILLVLAPHGLHLFTNEENQTDWAFVVGNQELLFFFEKIGVELFVFTLIEQGLLD